MRARQDAVEETRLAITEATMRLHERVGPRATTVSAVAEEANVTRLTVYRHFPTDEALVIACSAHWRELHPRPDPAAWAQIRDPVARLRTALSETYRWAATAAPMMTMIHRDVDVMPSFVGEYLAADEKRRVDRSRSWLSRPRPRCPRGCALLSRTRFGSARGSRCAATAT